MTDTVGNFNDLVQLSGDTLYVLGEELVVGNSVASTVTYGLSNSNGVLAVVGAPTANQTLWYPSKNGTLLENINISAGTTSNNLSAVTFSNSNGISFGLNGSIVTASVQAGAAAGIGGLQAGTQTATSGTVVFSYSNSVSFGMSNSSIVTASIVPGDVIVSNMGVYSSEYSNGTVSASTATIDWNNGNKQSVTLGNATITLSFTAPSFGGGATGNFQLRLIQDGTGSRTVLWTGGGLAINWVGGIAPTLSTAAGAVDIISLYYNGTAWYGSYGTNFATTGTPVSYITNINLSAGTTSNNLSNLVFSNSNGVSFGLNGSTVTANVIGPGAIQAGTQTNTSGTVIFSNSNNISFGMSNSSVVTASAWVNVSAGTTSNNLSSLVFSNSNGVTFGLNGSTITASAVGGGGGGVAQAAGTQTATSGTVVFSYSNSVSFGMSNSSIITASIVPGNIIASNLAVFSSEYSNGTSGATATINWNNGNKQKITLGSGTVTLTFTAPSFGGGAAGNYQLKLIQDGTGGRTVSWTDGGLVINWVGGVAPTLSTAAGAVDIVSFYFDGTNWYGSWGTNFATSGVAVNYITGINVSGGTTSNNLSALVFSNSNGVTFGLNGSTITASAVGGGGGGIAVAAGTQTATSGTAVFSNSNGFTFGMSNSSVVTAMYGKFSSFHNGAPATNFGPPSDAVQLQPFVLPYAMTVTNVLWLMNISGASNSSAGQSFSIGFYSVTGGNTGSISLISSFSTSQTYTSGAALSSYSGTQYRNMTVNSLALTPGPYVFAFYNSTVNGGSVSLYGTASGVSIGGTGTANITQFGPLPGLVTVQTTLSASYAMSATSWIRTGSQALLQPWFMLQGS